MIRAYAFALDPTDIEAEKLASHAGATRVAYNWCLARVKANWGQRAAEATYGIPEDERTPWVETSAYALRRSWNEAKHEVAPWWRENSKEAYATGCANLAAALVNQKSGRAKFPRFKSKRRATPSFRITTGVFGLGSDRRHVLIPVIGEVRTHESTRKLARRAEAGSAWILSAAVSYRRGRWQVSFSVELPDPPSSPRSKDRVVGVDLGVKSLAVLSTGEVVENPRRLDGELARLRRAQRVAARRRGPDRRNGVAPSNRWRKANARVTKLHARVSNLRRNDTHELTTRLVRDFDSIVIEDLAVSNLLRNRRLARSISDVGWGEIRRQLTYKAEWSGVTLVVADRWFPSSKTCSACGAVRAKLSLAERTFHCTSCGFYLDRDVNAARNLAALAGKHDTGESHREKLEGTRGRHDLGRAARLPREEPRAQPRHREMVSRQSASLRIAEQSPENRRCTIE